MDDLNRLISRIQPLDISLMEEARNRLNSLTKPQGSLGRLEELAEWLVGVTRQSRPRLGRKVIFTFVADHGIAAEGVSTFPQAVTPQMVYNFLRGGAAINALARNAGAEVVVADFGVAADFGNLPGLVARKVAHGTGAGFAGKRTRRHTLRHRRHGQREHHRRECFGGRIDRRSGRRSHGARHGCR